MTNDVGMRPTTSVAHSAFFMAGLTLYVVCFKNKNNFFIRAQKVTNKHLHTRDPTMLE